MVNLPSSSRLRINGCARILFSSSFRIVLELEPERWGCTKFEWTVRLGDAGKILPLALRRGNVGHVESRAVRILAMRG